MKLTIDYTGDSQSYDLKMDIELKIEQDAEALGYITSVLYEAACVLAKRMENANPKYKPRIANGVAHSMVEKEREQNPNYPFTTFVETDE